MNAKILLFVIYVGAITYLSLYNLHNCPFKMWGALRPHSKATPVINIQKWSFLCFQVFIINHVCR